ncbi:MAG: 4Fe-4S ferredoxin [Sulfobacillus benefaciens]|jgi:ferredoxin|uniref:4Fe-4S ferredoxin n=1 Tax=Sulfobacillus benefaciens TaxID=453960 RepID=A0A2T2X8B5_9FIRM|nr:MAG: 4Fe-4S ferredoxin [Sulfobacillus benefaciens]
MEFIPLSGLDGNADFNAVLQLYINAEPCIIDCGACVPVCPVGAIFKDEDLAPADKKCIAANTD